MILAAEVNKFAMRTNIFAGDETQEAQASVLDHFAWKGNLDGDMLFSDGFAFGLKVVKNLHKFLN